ncbi:OLC1v1028965C1 [Oldenlandia corymbosa var. corymbosa]|uniref:OLC1v1028965C1 n=1 Tax=Oldenlandia corymbosa var. corymbosa TaxID=529605 RepID=A0AAV1CFN4_OLDCO|nr:OLC1v1028965C1 [Oldenlandia corymbosa var. corymbosa]
MGERQRFADLLRKCSKSLLFYKGKEVHGAVVRKGYGLDLMIGNDIIDFYRKCGRLSLAHAVFDRMLERNIVSWTSLMCGYLQDGDAGKSLMLFREMVFSGVRPNEYTYSTNLKASGVLAAAFEGMQIHSLCCKWGYEWYPVVGNSVIDMYFKCGRVSDAESMFHAMPGRSLITWNVMIAGYALDIDGKKSLLLFKELREHGETPDEYTFTSTLKACSAAGAISEGTQIHALLTASGFPFLSQKILSAALIDLYVKCGFLIEAHKLFNEAEEKSAISWSALILGYAQEDDLSAALDLFRELRKGDNAIDGLVLSSMMSVFADFAFAELGKQLHSYAIKIPSDSKIIKLVG